MSLHIEDILSTPVGKPRVGARRKAAEPLQEGGLDGGGSETDIKRDVSKYSDKISKARRRLEVSALSKETVEEANKTLRDNELDQSVIDELEAKKEQCSQLILTTSEVKAEKEKMNTWEHLMDSAKKQLEIIQTMSARQNKQSVNQLNQKLILNGVREVQVLSSTDTLRAAKWVRQWKEILKTTNQSNREKCGTTLHKLDSTLKTSFNVILQKSENAWILKNLAKEGEPRYVYQSEQGEEYEIKRGQIYDPDFEILLKILLKEILQNVPERSMLLQMEQHKYQEGADIASHSEQFQDIMEAYELIKGRVDEQEKAQLFFKTLPTQWIDQYDLPSKPDLITAINWASEKARVRTEKMKFKYARVEEDINPVLGDKYLLPTKQILETIQAKIVRKEFDSADMQSLKNMISGRSTIDKLGNQESESEGEEPPKEKTRPRKKKDKKSDKDFVRTEDIAAIVAEAINATLEKKTKWCSHCKYENCFDDQGKLKAEMQKYIAPKDVFENHYVGECKKKFENNNYKRTEKWCGKCKSYEHAYAECNSRNLNKKRT